MPSRPCVQTNAFYIAHYITPLVFGASRGTRAARFHTALEHTSHLEAHNSSNDSRPDEGCDCANSGFFSQGGCLTRGAIL